MSTKLSPFLASYVESMNAHDNEAFIAHFAPGAIVQDEMQEYRGTAAIEAWIEDVHKKYQPTLEATGVRENGSEIVITGLVSGNFDGSPLELHHHLTITDGRIVALTIKA